MKRSPSASRRPHPKQPPKKTGRVFLVGAGPGDPGLLTLRGYEALRRADVVLYDALVHPVVVGYAADAKKIFVGKSSFSSEPKTQPEGAKQRCKSPDQSEINRQMAEYAR